MRIVKYVLLSVLVILLSSHVTERSSAADKKDVTIGTGGTAIGFLFVGPRDDFGYNQAAYLGSRGVEKAFPLMKILAVENVPETAEAERVMEEMIRSGAKIIFPTSYGHLDPALAVAKRHKDVLFFHQGGLKTAENLGTYFANVFEGVHLAGIAAGHMTKTGKLGYIISFPIPQVLLNINAFTLGVRSVRPDATVTVVFLGTWCDPGKQAAAAKSLIDQGVDVLTQHQDCTKTVVETAERAGIMVVGYHCDASELAPNGWITGAAWDWSSLYISMVKTGIEGKFKGSQYDGKYRVGLLGGSVKLASFGKNVPDDVKKFVMKKKEEMLAGRWYPFKGPVKDQSGKVRIEEDVIPTIEELETTDYLVEGVIGNIPK